jgi:hypothetical protein
MSTFTRFQKLRRKAPLAWLGHVFVGILSLDEDDRKVIAEEFNGVLGPWLEELGDGYMVTVDIMAETFRRLLELPPSSRPAMVDAINGVLRTLEQQDFFGTEGQCDPRGDHRS